MHLQLIDTKTKYSRRKIDLGPKVILELKKWKVACPENELNLMFPNEVCQPLNYSNLVQRYFLTALGKAILPKIRTT